MVATSDGSLETVACYGRQGYNELPLQVRAKKRSWIPLKFPKAIVKIDYSRGSGSGDAIDRVDLVPDRQVQKAKTSTTISQVSRWRSSVTGRYES